jgi:hypothetical protein
MFTHRRYVEPRRGVIEICLCDVHCQIQIKVAFMAAFFCTALTMLGINKTLL